MVSIFAAILIGQGGRPLDFVRPFLRGEHTFVVCAHRGDHVEAPENTMDAFEEAIKDDADFLETDLRLSKDGIVVLMHDETVDRTTAGKGPVSDFTAEQLQALPIKNERRKGEKAPTFEELLKAAKGHIKIYMDIKAVHPADVMPLVRKYRMEKDVIAYVYSPEQVDEWRAGAPDVPIISDFQMTSPDQIEETWKAHPFAITDGGHSDYKPEFVKRFHELKVAVVPDIQGRGEAPAKWKPMIDMGVDGLQTDHPKQLIAYLKKVGLR